MYAPRIMSATMSMEPMVDIMTRLPAIIAAMQSTISDERWYFCKA